MALIVYLSTVGPFLKLLNEALPELRAFDDVL